MVRRLKHAQMFGVASSGLIYCVNIQTRCSSVICRLNKKPSIRTLRKWQDITRVSSINANYRCRCKSFQYSCGMAPIICNIRPSNCSVRILGERLHRLMSFCAYEHLARVSDLRSANLQWKTGSLQSLRMPERGKNLMTSSLDKAEDIY